MDALEVALEVRPDLRVHLHHGTKDRLVELERLDLAARTHGRRSVSLLENADLSEGVPRPERPE